MKHKEDERDRLAKVEQEKLIRDKRMKDQEDKDNRERDLWYPKLIQEIKAEEERVARLRLELEEKIREIERRKQEAEARARKKREDEEELQKQRAVNLQKLRDQLSYQHVYENEEKEKYNILKEIEIEQLELYERYHVEKTMQAEEYQTSIQELLIT